MLRNILIATIVGVLLFEFFEHAVFPLVWLLVGRKRKSPCGPEGLIGEVAVVKQWEGVSGRVVIHGESWSAAGRVPFCAGDQAVVESMEGLTLKVAPLRHPTVQEPSRGAKGHHGR